MDNQPSSDAPGHSEVRQIDGESSGRKFVRRELLSVLRIYLGVILFVTVLGKLTRDTPFVSEMTGYLTTVPERRASPWYLAFLHNVVIPHARLFSYLVVTGEVVASISLLLGLCARVGGLIAMWLFLNYMFSKGRIFWSPDSEDAAVFFVALVVFLGRAGRAWGLDVLLARRWPKSWLW
jgi:thiosulfate dehydrogenase [quinone] large subunit